MRIKVEKPISILHVVISLETGGLERFVLDLVHATTPNFRHKIVCLERTGKLSESCGMSEIISLEIKPGIQVNAVFSICSLVRENQIDVIHTHNEKALFYGALSGFFSRTPVIHTKHGKNSVTFKPRLKNNILSRFCDKVVAVSRDAALQCINDEKIPASKVLTILNGIDTDLFSSGRDVSALKVTLGIDVGIPVIGIVARLAKVKDHATLLAACRIIKDSGIDFRLLIVGDGPLMGDLVACADALGLNNQIVFTGARSDIPDLMSAMDVFALSSLSEGISLTIIEAMACELPVVATDVGGNSEVVVHGETGFLVPMQNPTLMAERIQQLLNNTALRKGFGKNGHLRAKEHFSIKRAAQQYEELYRAMLRGR